MALDDLSLGPLVIGFALSTFLFGITTTQAYIYYGKFPDDPLRFKVLVTFLWLMELAHTICLTASMYRFFVTLFGSPDVLLRTPTALNVAIIFGCIIAFIAQGFFIYRLWKTSNRQMIAGLLIFLSFVRLGFNLAVGVEAFLVDLATLSTKFDWLITSVWIISAIVDVLITMCLCLEMYRRRKNALEKTAALLDKIIIWTVETGLITSTAAVSLTICFLAMKKNLVWLGLYFFLPRLFAICVIASINARYSLGRAQKGSSGIISLPQSRQQYNGDTNASVVASQNLEIGIAIEMSTVTDDATDTEGAKLQL